MASLSSIGRWGGLAFMFGNVLFLVNKLDEMSRLFLGRPMTDVISGQNPGLIVLGQSALIFGYVALYRVYSEGAERQGKTALRLFSGGGTVLAVGHVSFMTALADVLPPTILPYAESAFLLVILGLLFMLIGLIWFGILRLRPPRASRWPWLPLATGTMGFLGFFIFNGDPITAIFLFFRTLFALGLIGLGLRLWLDSAPSRSRRTE